MGKKRLSTSSEPRNKLTKVRSPALVYRPSRWALLRNENVERMAEQWEQEPGLVLVLNDPKLKGKDLVVLQREHLESMEKLLRDLADGQAVIGAEVRTLLDAVMHLKRLAKEHQWLEKQDDSVVSGMKMLFRIRRLVRTSVRLVGQPRPVAPTPIAPEELEGLPDED